MSQSWNWRRFPNLPWSPPRRRPRCRYGYVIVGKQIAPGGSCVADVWWSPDLIHWTRARGANDTAGSSQALAVAADDDDRMVALGVQTRHGVTTPLAELSADDGATWRQVPSGTAGAGSLSTPA